MEGKQGKRKHSDDSRRDGDRKNKQAKTNESRQDENRSLDSAEHHSSIINEKINGHRSSREEKVARLLRSLDELLDDGGEDDARSVLGSGTLEQCLALRKTLKNHASVKDATSLKDSSTANIPASISHLSVTPWAAKSIPRRLPPLPEILDPTLKAGVFIHQGITSGGLSDLSYERLEWVGDAYLYITATLLISQTFPALLPGKCSQMRERVVKNVQLAAYAKQYGFDSKAKLPEDSASHKDTEKTKMLGDIFEAYVAAIILSDPINGVARCTEWLKALWSMTLEKDIIAVEQVPKLDSPLWRLRGAEESAQRPAPKPVSSYPAKDRLRIAICSPGIELAYRDCAPQRKDPINKLPIFSIGVFLTGWGEKDRKLGFGSAHGKKEAGQKAAEMALSNTKLISTYAEKKKLFDAQKELERKALEAA